MLDSSAIDALFARATSVPPPPREAIERMLRAQHELSPAELWENFVTANLVPAPWSDDPLSFGLECPRCEGFGAEPFDPRTGDYELPLQVCQRCLGDGALRAPHPPTIAAAVAASAHGHALVTAQALARDWSFRWGHRPGAAARVLFSFAPDVVPPSPKSARALAWPMTRAENNAPVATMRAVAAARTRHPEQDWWLDQLARDLLDRASLAYDETIFEPLFALWQSGLVPVSVSALRVVIGYRCGPF